MGKRRRAREMVLQALYESEFSDRSSSQVVEEQIGRRGPSEEGADRARDLFLKTVEKREELDRIIREYLENWDFERLSLIDRNILRFALAEVLYFPDVPSSVIIDEAIEIAHRYSSEDAGRLV
ncbi:MAG TPA: transcription antitermination factor NusB, partial [Candidatus Krumholzibacteria bacterium]|nr:transcription antitermination factor NusB [Candidatus Krumholzibacteria bacterium]